jgi:hypothetical protein
MSSDLASAPPAIQAAEGVACQVRATMACVPGPRLNVRPVAAMGPARAAVTFSGPPAHRLRLQLPRRRRRWPGTPQLKGVRPELCWCARVLLAAGYRVEYVYADRGGYLAVWPAAPEAASATRPAGIPESRPK